MNTVEEKENRSGKQDTKGYAGGDQGKGRYFPWSVRECLTEKVTCELSPEGGKASGTCHVGARGRAIAETLMTEVLLFLLLEGL